MRPDISEFSYGYALTEELVCRSGMPLRAAPLFPSLIAEGRVGGGFDVSIPFVGHLLFLQFKLSDCMVRDTAFECQGGYLSPPFYRMHLRPRRHSQQHQLLLDLENRGELVFYAAPHFHTPMELNDAYLNGHVIDRSIFVQPSQIGPLPDDANHHVAFGSGEGAFFCSEPKLLLGESEFRMSFEDKVIVGLEQQRWFDGSADSVRHLAAELIECVMERLPTGGLSPDELERLKNHDPRLQISYLARSFFACEILLVASK